MNIRKLLLLVKPFAETMPKHRHKFDMLKAIESVAEVRYWHRDGSIKNIVEQLEQSGFVPDFILHYDIEWNNAFSPHITGWEKVNIKKGCYVLDVHYDPEKRRSYFHHTAKPDIIFSASKYPFLNRFPDCASRFHWLPFGINPEMIKDYELEKTIRYSLLGLMDAKYPFRHAVLKQMKGLEGFVHFKHPGHRTPQRPGLLVEEEYAKSINRSLLSFTCGSMLRIPVAKFFEIPGCRSLMLAEPNPDIEELGFQDGINYVACDKENLLRKAAYYARETGERERLTDEGFLFIHKHHTNQIRAKQLVDAILQ